MTTVLTRDTFAAGLIAQGVVTVPAPVNGTDPATKDYVDAKGVPVGTVFQWTADQSNTPLGWLPCAGQAVGRSSYPALFALIGTTYGAGNGSTTFNVPSMKTMIATGPDTFIVRVSIIKW